jgi:glycerol-3-phosphate dehydrogenase (NAD(P)+)
MGRNISVFGAGSMGTAVSVLLAGNRHSVKLWTPFREEADMITRLREQKDKLPGVKVPDSVCCTVDMDEAVQFSDICVLVIPSQTVRENVRKIASSAGNRS